MDINEKYVLESQDEKPIEEKVIVRTFDVKQTETFTIKELEEKIVRIEEGRDAYVAERNAEIEAVQEKIDEATLALGIK